MEKNDNKSAPFVSFIVPYHNEDVAMLSECIDSLLALTLARTEREVIVVDDGSDYSPMNELLRYGDDIIYVRKPNGGLSTARNLGLAMATGQYIQFVDSDDTLVPQAYERCLDTARYQEPDMVMFDFCNDPKESRLDFGINSEPVTGAEFMRHNNIRATAWGYLFRKDILHELRFTPNLVHEDEEFTPQLILRCERLFSLPVKAYCYRRREQSITGKKDPKWLLRRLDDTEYVIMSLYRLSERLPHTDRIALRRRVDQLTMDYLYNTIRLTRSLKNLRERISRLEPLGLYPLPDRGYTRKYSMFRKMVNSSLGQRMLIVSIPLLRQ
ncbi:MAG: glycosyltransferase family 2 protein [Prevotella sp.]